MRHVTALFPMGALCALLLAIPALAAVKAAPDRAVWAPEQLSGKVVMIGSDQKMVVVQGPDGVLFDMVLTPKTRIISGHGAIPHNDVAQLQNKSVSIRFIPERRGDIAEWIRLGN